MTQKLPTAFRVKIIIFQWVMNYLQMDSYEAEVNLQAPTVEIMEITPII